MPMLAAVRDARVRFRLALAQSRLMQAMATVLRLAQAGEASACHPPISIDLKPAAGMAMYICEASVEPWRLTVMRLAPSNGGRAIKVAVGCTKRGAAGAT